jgi:hypothetical protein
LQNYYAAAALSQRKKLLWLAKQPSKEFVVYAVVKKLGFALSLVGQHRDPVAQG